jgi:putative photosynthetic complex assembly protein 2
MSAPAVARLESRRNSAPDANRGTSARGVAIVVGFWWLTTGLLLVAQRSMATRLLALSVATGLAVIGARWIAVSREDLTARGATRSFFGGALLWFWVATLLYGGWVVGIPTGLAAADASRGSLAAEAIAATLYNDVLGLAVIAGALLLARGGANRAGALAVVTFWCSHQLAKLNVFAGVVHPGTEFLPPYLRHLERYFGPPENSPLLGVSVVVLFAIAAVLAFGSARATVAWRRRQSALLAALIALAALEHVLLGVRSSNALWDVFLSRARG